MPLVMAGDRTPTLWAGKKPSRPAETANRCDVRSECIEIALINNMPDAALEDTEIQFFELLDAASGDIPVRVKLYSLPGVPRGDRGQQHLDSFYFGINDLLNSRFDAAIITGTEPRQPNLRDEPYWPIFTEVLDWAERHTTSTVLSCLAAHASVLHSDGIERCPLSDKQFGVFRYRTVSDHALTGRAAERIQFPHSRWNEVREDALISCGYTVLTSSVEAGVDSFVKKKKDSLFVHFQGHPEYGARTLLKEFRRDIKRFLRGERQTYPSMPKGYFDTAAAKILTAFQGKAQSDRREGLMTTFPEPEVVSTIENTWRASATCVYRNWVQYVMSKKADASVYPAHGSGRANRVHTSQ
jgi:homoserine O-succinyltransferase/O-acetyltransferase